MSLLMWSGLDHWAVPQLPRAIWQLFPWAVWPCWIRVPVARAEQMDSHFAEKLAGSPSQRYWAQACSEFSRIACCTVSTKSDGIQDRPVRGVEIRPCTLTMDCPHCWRARRYRKVNLNPLLLINSQTKRQKSNRDDFLGLLGHPGLKMPR